MLMILCLGKNMGLEINKEDMEELIEVQSFMERYHPDKAIASRSIHIFNDKAMYNFRNILKCKPKKILLDQTKWDSNRIEWW